MNARTLETFLAIVRLGSFRLAAERLNITQSTVSARIDELEKQLGRTLFSRVGRRSLPNEHGRSLVALAEQFVATAARIRDEIGDPGARSQIVRIGLVEMIAITWLPVFAAAVAKDFPSVDLHITVQPTAALDHLLAQGEIDIAFIPEPPAMTRYASVSLGSVRWGWVASPGMALPEGVLGPAAFEALPLITLGSQSLVFNRIMRWFAAGGLAPRRLTICDSISVVASLAKAGLGISFLPVGHLGDDAGLKSLAFAPEVASFRYVALFDAMRAGSTVTRLCERAREISLFRKEVSEAPTAPL